MESHIKAVKAWCILKENGQLSRSGLANDMFLFNEKPKGDHFPSSQIVEVLITPVTRHSPQVEGEKEYGYASRLFKELHPECDVLPDLMGVLTQLDNSIAGYLSEIERLKKPIIHCNGYAPGTVVEFNVQNFNTCIQDNIKMQEEIDLLKKENDILKKTKEAQGVIIGRWSDKNRVYKERLSEYEVREYNHYTKIEQQRKHLDEARCTFWMIYSITTGQYEHDLEAAEISDINLIQNESKIMFELLSTPDQPDLKQNNK